MSKFLISVPGKVLLLGGYAVLLGKKGFALALNDNKGLGFLAEAYNSAKEEIKSSYFYADLSCKEDIENYKHEPAVFSYLIAKEWHMKKFKKFKKARIDIKGNKIFGIQNAKTGLGGSACSIVSSIMSVFAVNETIYEFLNDAHGLCFKSAFMLNKNASGYDIATSLYGTCIYRKYMKKDKKGGIFNAVNIKCNELKQNFLILNIKGKSTDTKKSISAFMQALEERGGGVKKVINQQSLIEHEIMKLFIQDNENRGQNYFDMKAMSYKLIDKKRELNKFMLKYGADEVVPDEVYGFLKNLRELKAISGCFITGAGGYDNIAIILNKHALKGLKAFDKLKDEIISKSEFDIEFLDVMQDNSGARFYEIQ
ncbi:MAG: hypothetical protein QXS91_01065 [Candidatus Anstonellales archaeon]